MLTSLKPTLAAHLQAALYSLRSFRLHPFSSCLTGLIIAATLSMPVSFWILSQSIQSTLTAWQKAAHVAVYFKMDTPTETLSKTLHTMEQDKAIAQATFISPEAGLKTLTTQTHLHDMMHYLPTNPLPAMVEVTLQDTIYGSEEKMHAVCERLKTLPGVELVELDTTWLNQLHHTLSFVRVFIQCIMGLLLLAVVCIIAYTLRLTLYQRFEEIQVLKLLGADDAYIIRPFLYTGIGYGLLGAMGTIFCVSLLLLGLNHALKTFELIQFPTTLSMSQSYSILLMAIFLGFIAAQVTIRRALSSLMHEFQI